MGIHKKSGREAGRNKKAETNIGKYRCCREKKTRNWVGRTDL